MKDVMNKLVSLAAVCGLLALGAACGNGQPGATGTGGTSTASGTGTGGHAGTTGTGGAGASCAITSTSGHIYYVARGAPSAADSNPGTKAKPWLTIQAAGPVVKPGDTVVVEPGIYAGAVFGWDPANSGPYSTIAGTAKDHITIEADPSLPPGNVVIGFKNDKSPVAFDLEPGCDYVDIVGFTVTTDSTVTKAGIKVAGSTGNRILNNTVDGVAGIGGILVDNVTGVLIQGNTVTHTLGTGDTGHGMYLSGSSVGVQVLHNLVHDNAYVGIHVNGDISEMGAGVVTGALIAGNVIHDNGQNGINADGLQGSTIENNLIYANARNGIELYQIDALGGSTGNFIVGNSIDQANGEYAIAVGECQYDNQAAAPTPAGCVKSPFDTSTGNVAFDNVLLGGQAAESVVSAADLSLSTNLETGTPSPFTDVAKGDYSLAAGGPGKGAGIASFGGATAPADGSQHDIGAFSFGLVLLCP
jgi:hypothetical protein